MSPFWFGVLMGIVGLAGVILLLYGTAQLRRPPQPPPPAPPSPPVVRARIVDDDAPPV